VNRCCTKNFAWLFWMLLVMSIFIAPQAGASSPPPFTVEAKAAVLFDALSGQVVCEQKGQERIAPASLLKILTLYLAFDDLKKGTIKLSDQVLVSKRAWTTEGSKMFIEAGTRVELQKLIEGVAAVSGNDACVALAEYIAGAEETFVTRMNEKARSLGLVNSQFRNVNGLDAEGQYTTALDIGTIACHYIKEHPEALRIHSIKEFTYSGITQRNRNGLLWLDEGVDGLKTGWINHNGGFHLIATAKKGDQRFIAVVMGAKNRRIRENEALKLLNYGFKNFSSVTLFPSGVPVATVSVWKGKVNQVSLIPDGTAVFTVPKGEEQSLSLRKDIPTKVFAPVKKGEKMGGLEVIRQGEVIKKVDLIAQDEVPRARIITLFMHMLVLSFVSPPYWGYGIVLLAFVLLFTPRLFRRRVK